MAIPLYGFLYGDTMGLVILAQEDETVAQLACKLQQAAAVRVAPCGAADLLLDGRVIDPSRRIGAIGLKPLDRFDVVPKGT